MSSGPGPPRITFGPLLTVSVSFALPQVMFWRQSNQLISGEKIWDIGRRRDASLTCAKMFWWFNMYSSADWSVTEGSGTRPR